MEQVVPCLENAHVGLLNDNSPTISWVKRLTSTRSRTAAALIRVLSLRLRLAKASPLIPMHIPGVQNSISDIPSRSFGKHVKWHFKTDNDLLTFFNEHFQLPSQNCWSVYHIPSELCTRVISVLLTHSTEMHEWNRLSKPRVNTSQRGFPMQNLWEWTLTCRQSTASTETKLEPCSDSVPESRPDTTATTARLELHRSIQLSRPLARRFPWTGSTTR